MTVVNKKTVRTLFITSSTLVCVYALLPQGVLGATTEYVPLIGLPGLNTPAATRTLVDYINAIYYLTIVIGSLVGVMRLAFAGVKYSVSDVVTDKHAAMHDIQGVLLGLAILLIPFIVLKTINPDLIRLDVLHNANKVNLEVSQSAEGLNPRAIAAGASTPAEVSALLNSCPGRVAVVGTNAYCCTAEGFTGSGSCGNADVLFNNNNIVGIDTGTLYGTVEEVENRVADGIANTNAGNVETKVFSNVTGSMQTLCNDWAKGKTGTITAIPVKMQTPNVTSQKQNPIIDGVVCAIK